MKKILACSFMVLAATLTSSCNRKSYSSYIVSCMGDSITYGYTPGSGKQLPLPYPTALKRYMGFKQVHNYGISGSSVANGDGSYYPMVERIRNIDPSSNLIIFWGSGNDIRLDLPLGNKGDKVTTTYYGALYDICTYLNTNFKSAFKMFITPLPAKVDGVLYYLTDLKEAIEYTCDIFKIPVLNLTYNSGFEEEIEAGLNDGVHPSQVYVINTLTPKIADFIKSHL